MSVDGTSETELDRLAEEFVARTREGESPTVSSYARAHPELASEITDLFPLLLDLEGGRDPDAAPGRELGEYLLLREIGRGGMGVVYEAVQKTLGRRVALKILPKQMTLDARFLERFRLEAQAAASLQHPHIVPVIGWGEDQGVTYYTMQFVDGCGLDEVLPHVRRLFGQARSDDTDHESGSALAHRMLSAPWRREKRDEPTPPPSSERLAPGRTYYDNVARFLLQASEGIAAAHARGVLHRDVKPSNLLLDDKGTVWISDFGLCKETESGGLTQPGDLLGTFRYMAPERFEGVSDVQGDVYGLGMTLYELLTREAAYQGDDRAALAAQIVHAAPTRPRKLDARIPRDLELIVLKAIARDRGQRYATADALAADLRAYLDGRPIAARPPTVAYLLRTAVRRHKSIAVFGTLAVLALIGSTAFYVVSLREKESTARFRQYVANIAAAETALRDRDMPVAQRLLDEAPEEFRNWEWRLLRARLDRSLRSFPRWKWPVRLVAHSPDGKLLASCAAGKTRVHDGETTELLGTITHHTHLRAFDWHPQGGAFAVGTKRGVEVWSWPDAKRLVDRPIGDVRAVRFTPDGSRLLVGSDDGVLRVGDTATREEVSAHALHSEIHALAIDPTGRRVAVGCLDASVSVFDLTTSKRLWRQRVGRRDIPALAFVGADLLAVPSSDGSVEVRRADDGTVVHVLGHDARPRGVAAAPDARRLLTWAGSQLHVWDAQRGERLLTYGNDSPSRCGSFHPDGTMVVTGSNRGSVLAWLVPEDGDPDVRVAGHRNLETVDFAPSGAWFVTGGQILRLFDARTHEEMRNWFGHHGAVKCVRVSPDNEWVASSDVAGEALIWHVPTDTLRHRLTVVEGNPHNAGPAATGLAFSADTKRLFTCGYDGTVRVWSVATGEQLTHRVVAPKNLLVSLTVSHDGRWVAVGEYGGLVHILRAKDLSTVHTCEGQTSVIIGLAFQPGDRLLASASFDRTVRLWDVASGASVRTLRALTSDSSGVADAFLKVSFLPDGSRVVASSADGSAKLWDTDSGRLVATVRGEHGWMWDACFSPDAARLVTLEGRGIVRIWETQPLRERVAAMRPDPEVAAAAREVLGAARRTHDDPDAVIAAVRARRDLDASVREAALRRAYRARGTESALRARLWRTFLPRATSRRAHDVDLAVARELREAGRHDGVQDGERETLWALAALRAGHLKTVTSDRQVSRLVNQHGNPALHAVDLAVIAIAFAQEKSPVAAKTWMDKLEAWLAKAPALRDDPRIAALYAEARARVRDE